jgi:N-acylneuraminate cytidylyltransferase
MEFSHPTTRLIKIKNKYIYFKNKKYINQRSQDSEKEFHDAGCFYFFKTDKFLKERKLFLKKTGFFILKKYSHVDINTVEDLILAKKLFIK